MPGGFRWLQKNVREDVILYFETMAAMLEEKLLTHIDLPPIEKRVPAEAWEHD